MKIGKFSFIGTTLAVVAILIMIFVYKFVLKEDFTPKETIVKPTEYETFEFIEGGSFGVLPKN